MARATGPARSRRADAPLERFTSDPRAIAPLLVGDVVNDGLTPAAALANRVAGASADVEAALATATQYAAALREAPHEIDAIFEELEGHWVEPGPMGEPFRRPEVLPPGRVLYNFDLNLVPTVEAEAIGIRQAEVQITAYREENGGAAEETLKAAGEAPEKANQLALARVFSPAPGAYSPSIQFLAKSGDQRGDEARMAHLYTRRLSHAYGGGLYGAYSRTTFEGNLATTDAATLPRSSDVNGLLDHPMSAAFLGGLNMAAKAVTGEDLPLYVSNLRDLDDPSIETAARALQTELRTRYFNPQWIKENQAHGYDGARNFMFMTDHLDLWDTTATDVAAPGTQSVSGRVVEDVTPPSNERAAAPKRRHTAARSGPPAVEQG